MKIITTVADMILWRASVENDRRQSSRIGFVPTMGALHAGHASLLQAARKDSDFVVLSIFVNPTQFNDSNDFAKYPKTWDADLAIATAENVDVVFAPTFNEIYTDDYRYKISETSFSKELCGAHRPGHFDGVLTVVMRLLQIVLPTNAFFGEKDYQQFLLIKEMASAFFLRCKIVPCPTQRESDGLAMSSRNVRLTKAGREKAPLIFKTISDSISARAAKTKLAELGFDVEYVVDKLDRRFVAVKLDDVRLIDNVKI